MKILLDENMPAKVNYDFGLQYEVYTVKEMGWLGKKNGDLLKIASSNSIDIFITMDKNLKNQHNLNKYPLKFIVLSAKNNKHQTVQPYITTIKRLLGNKKSLPKISIVTAESFSF